MGSLVRVFPRRNNLIAIVAGIVLAGAPLIAFNFWLGRLVDTQGGEQISIAAKRAVSLAEARLNQTITALDELAAKSVNSCTPGHVETLRQAAFNTSTIKEIAIIGPDGQTLCTQLGTPLGQRKLISSEQLTGAEGYTLDIIQIANGQRMVQLRHHAGSGQNMIGALVPVILLLPQVTVDGSPFGAYAQIVTRDGILIGSTGERPDDVDTRFSVAAKSSKLGIESEIMVPREMVPATHDSLKWLSMFATGIFIIVLAVFAIMMPRPQVNNPVTEIVNALDAGEFVPYYQPIVDIRSGQLRGAEVLVRWKKPDGSLVLPGAFIPLAESSGLILDMTTDLMRRVCTEAGEAIGCRPAMKISFNFAGQLFSGDAIVKEVRNIFSGSPIKLSQVVLELTERDPIENFTVTRQVIAALQELGIRIAIDDVGTGHSGLSYMLKLGVDIIKIDKMFVDAIGTDRNSTTIVETLVDLANNMRMDVVAEGVENFEQVMHLRELGIRSAQGYVFAPPLPGSAFLQLIEAIDPLPVAAVEEKLASVRGRFNAA
jgi:sensor c-di-GMP phosphodiesterase-like protein